MNLASECGRSGLSRARVGRGVVGRGERVLEGGRGMLQVEIEVPGAYSPITSSGVAVIGLAFEEDRIKSADLQNGLVTVDSETIHPQAMSSR